MGSTPCDALGKPCRGPTPGVAAAAGPLLRGCHGAGAAARCGGRGAAAHGAQPGAQRGGAVPALEFGGLVTMSFYDLRWSSDGVSMT